MQAGGVRAAAGGPAHGRHTPGERPAGAPREPAAARMRLAQRIEASQPPAEIERAGSIAGAGASRRPPFPLPALNLAAGAPIV